MAGAILPLMQEKCESHNITVLQRNYYPHYNNEKIVLSYYRLRLSLDLLLLLPDGVLPLELRFWRLPKLNAPPPAILPKPLPEAPPNGWLAVLWPSTWSNGLVPALDACAGEMPDV